MAVTTAIAVYFLIWWVVLFAVLPWGVRPQGESRPAGTDPGAPMFARLGRRLIWTTAIATVIFVLCAVVYIYRLVTLDDLAALFGMPR
jgi:predicted secreted protein